MTDKKKIGVIGYSGVIGKMVIEYLYPNYKIRGGCRHLINCNYNIEQLQIDIGEKKSIEKFCTGCDLIINCAGPSFLIKDAIVQCAADKKIPYIDAFGANLLEERIKRTEIDKKTVSVISAGVFPGLSGILLKWLSEKYDELQIVAGYAGGQEHCSWSATMDLLLSTKYDFGISNAEYCEGKVIRNSNGNNISTELPGISQKVYLQKFLSSETIRIAKQIKAQSVTWYTVLSNKDIFAKLAEAYSGIIHEQDMDKISNIASELSGISSMFADGGKRWYSIIIETSGIIAGEFLKKRLVVQSRNSSMISGMVIGKSAEKILKNNYKPGIYWADEILEGDEILEELHKHGIIENYQLVDIPFMTQEIEDYEEGVL